MSDELTPGATHGSDGLDAGPGGTELATALRELAHDHETPVLVPGTEIRRRAGRRRRRRQVSIAAAGATAAGALALVVTVALTGGHDAGSTPPAASRTAPTPRPSDEAGQVPVAAKVDLGRREMFVEGRTLPISSGSVKTPTPTGMMTVTAKYQAATVPGDSAGWNGYDVKATWVMRLRASDDRTNYLLALTWDEKAPGNYDRTGGVIGLRRGDAMWLYEALKPGSVVEVVGAAPAEASGGTGPGAMETAPAGAGALETPPTRAGALEATPTARVGATP